MKRRGICPACGATVPRWWFVSRKFRPCPACGVPIKAVKRYDQYWSRVIGALAPFTAGPVFMLVLLVFKPHAAGFEVFQFFFAGLFFGSFPLGMAAGFWFFPYFAPFETNEETTPHCRQCDYDLTGNTSGVCPECGTPAH